MNAKTLVRAIALPALLASASLTSSSAFARFSMADQALGHILQVGVDQGVILGLDQTVAQLRTSGEIVWSGVHYNVSAGMHELLKGLLVRAQTTGRPFKVLSFARHAGSHGGDGIVRAIDLQMADGENLYIDNPNIINAVAGVIHSLPSGRPFVPTANSYSIGFPRTAYKQGDVKPKDCHAGTVGDPHPLQTDKHDYTSFVTHDVFENQDRFDVFLSPKHNECSPTGDLVSTIGHMNSPEARDAISSAVESAKSLGAAFHLGYADALNHLHIAVDTNKHPLP